MRCVALVLLAALPAKAADGDSCSDDGFAKVNGEYERSLDGCTLNADNYYGFYLANHPAPPNDNTRFSHTLVDFAGTNADGFLKRLTANRVGAPGTFFNGSDDSELTSVAHVAFYNPVAKSNDRLQVVLGGHNAEPKSYTRFMSRAAFYGYHVISLAYVNEVNADDCKNWADALSEGKAWIDDCILELLRFKADGTALDPLRQGLFDTQLQILQADPAGPEDSINNRLTLLLTWLHAKFPSQGWDAFFEVLCPGVACIGVNVRWDKVALAGHSMGGDTAYYVGRQHKLI